MLEIARELGIAIASTEEFKEMIQARKRMTEDTELMNVFQQMNAKKQQILLSLDDNPETFVSCSSITKDIEKLQNQMLENPLFVQTLIAEQNFQELLSKVNSEISSCLNAELSSEEWNEILHISEDELYH